MYYFDIISSSKENFLLNFHSCRVSLVPYLFAVKHTVHAVLYITIFAHEKLYQASYQFLHFILETLKPDSSKVNYEARSP